MKPKARDLQGVAYGAWVKLLVEKAQLKAELKLRDLTLAETREIRNKLSRLARLIVDAEAKYYSFNKKRG